MALSPIVPFEPMSTDRLPAGDAWIAQVKWDGVRMLTYREETSTRLVNRRLNERTSQYPELADSGAYCSARSVILDGEVIALKDGKPSFHEVMRRDGLRKLGNVDVVKREVPIVYMVFDMLYVNGQWITNKPLRERQELIAAVIRPNDYVQWVPSFPEPDELYRVMEQHGMEGVVAKDLNSSYLIDGKDKRWMKKKIYRDLIAVVGGVTYRGGQVNALLLGLYDPEGRLWYIGHAGTGRLTQSDWRDLTHKTRSVRQEKRPFVNAPERSKGADWLIPSLTVKIHFAEWTPGGQLRQPSIQGLIDAPLESCTFQQG